jgi:translation initiation factor IF-1
MKEDLQLVVPATVIAVRRNACHVALDNGPVILAHLAGRMLHNKIYVVAGDRVDVAITPYDPHRGRIIFRQLVKS